MKTSQSIKPDAPAESLERAARLVPDKLEPAVEKDAQGNMIMDAKGLGVT